MNYIEINEELEKYIISTIRNNSSKYELHIEIEEKKINQKIFNEILIRESSEGYKFTSLSQTKFLEMAKIDDYITDITKLNGSYIFNSNNIKFESYFDKIRNIIKWLDGNLLIEIDTGVLEEVYNSEEIFLIILEKLIKDFEDNPGKYNLEYISYTLLELVTHLVSSFNGLSLDTIQFLLNHPKFNLLNTTCFYENNTIEQVLGYDIYKQYILNGKINNIAKYDNYDLLFYFYNHKKIFSDIYLELKKDKAKDFPKFYRNWEISTYSKKNKEKTSKNYQEAETSIDNIYYMLKEIDIIENRNFGNEISLETINLFNIDNSIIYLLLDFYSKNDINNENIFFSDGAIKDKELVVTKLSHIKDFIGKVGEEKAYDFLLEVGKSLSYINNDYFFVNIEDTELDIDKKTIEFIKQFSIKQYEKRINIEKDYYNKAIQLIENNIKLSSQNKFRVFVGDYCTDIYIEYFQNSLKSDYIIEYFEDISKDTIIENEMNSLILEFNKFINYNINNKICFLFNNTSNKLFNSYYFEKQ